MYIHMQTIVIISSVFSFALWLLTTFSSSFHCSSSSSFSFSLFFFCLSFTLISIVNIYCFFFSFVHLNTLTPKLVVCAWHRKYSFSFGIRDRNSLNLVNFSKIIGYILLYLQCYKKNTATPPPHYNHHQQQAHTVSHSLARSSCVESIRDKNLVLQTHVQSSYTLKVCISFCVYIIYLQCF